MKSNVCKKMHQASPNYFNRIRSRNLPSMCPTALKDRTQKPSNKLQIRTLAEQWVIKLQGWTAEMMELITPNLYKSQIEGIVPTKNVEKGEWKLLVPKHKYKQTISWLKEHWDKLMDIIPTELYMEALPDAPKIASRHSAGTEASSEDGTVDTYGTILSSLYHGHEDEADAQTQDSENEQEAQSENVNCAPCHMHKFWVEQTPRYHKYQAGLIIELMS